MVINEDIKKMAAKQTADQIFAMGGGTKLKIMYHVVETGLLPAVNAVGLLGVPVANLDDFEGQLNRAAECLRDHPYGEEMLDFVEMVKCAYFTSLSKLELVVQQEQQRTNMQMTGDAPLAPAPKSIIVGNAKFVTAKIKRNNVRKIGAEKDSKPNASRLARMVVSQLHFALYKSGMYLYEDGRYKLVTPSRLKRLLNSFLREEAEKYGAAKLYDHVIEFLDCEQDLVVDDKVFERTIFLIAFRNGFLDTINGRFYPPDYRLFFTSNIALDYHEAEEYCHNFDDFLVQIMGGDEGLIARVYEMIGFILSNDMNAKAIFCAQGVSNSGKSTIARVVSSLFDEDLVTALSVGEMDRSFAISEMVGKALCIDTELSAAPIREGSSAKLKQLCSNDLLSTDIKYKERLRFICRAKIFLATNHPVQLAHADQALINRIVAIPFYYEIPKEQWDTQILKKFEAEKLAIAKKAIWHYCRLRDRNYVFSGSYKLNEMFVNQEQRTNAKAFYSDRDELIRCFVEQRCQLTTLEGWASTAAIHAAYTEFCKQYNSLPCDQKCLTALLKQMLNGKVEQTKKRVEPGANPSSVLLGIVLK